MWFKAVLGLCESFDSKSVVSMHRLQVYFNAIEIIL